MSPLSEVLDVGPQPVSNRYRELDESSPEYKHPMVLGSCPRCGLLQLETPFPVDELRPQISGIAYKEAEGHLDALVDRLLSLPGINRDSIFWGLSFKDDSTLQRIKDRGYAHTFRLDVQTDLGIQDERSGVETLQEKITEATLSTISRQKGSPDVILARHILEHTYQPTLFLKALLSVLNPSGRIVFEIPSCDRALRASDYTMIWEDHILYFTPETFKRTLSIAGLAVNWFNAFPYPLEDSLVAIASKADVPEQWSHASPAEASLADRYGKSFAANRNELQKVVRQLKEQGPLALLGAGHLSCYFINLLDLGDAIDYVLDDHPRKQGRRMPGSHKKIEASALLQQGKVKQCLLAVSPESQKVVLEKNRSYLQAGGKFLSIFPGAPLSEVPFLGQDSTS